MESFRGGSRVWLRTHWFLPGVGVGSISALLHAYVFKNAYVSREATNMAQSTRIFGGQVGVGSSPLDQQLPCIIR